MAKFQVKAKKNVNIMRVVGKLFATLLGLWVGGTLISNLGTVMKCTASPFYTGLNLIGWTVLDAFVPNSAVGEAAGCNSTTYFASTAATYNGVVTATTGSGILGIIGLVGVASIILEFVYFKL
jgi:hypothetical protein